MAQVKTCPDCGQPMMILFQWDYYCPNCDDTDTSEDPWDIEFCPSTECKCAPKHRYVHDDKVWCRACGDFKRELEKN